MHGGVEDWEGNTKDNYQKYKTLFVKATLEKLNWENDTEHEAYPLLSLYFQFIWFLWHAYLSYSDVVLFCMLKSIELLFNLYLGGLGFYLVESHSAYSHFSKHIQIHCPALCWLQMLRL